MTTRLLRLFSPLVVGAALVFGQVSVAFAGPATDTVKARQDTLRELLKAGTPEANKKIAAIFDEVLDYDALAEASLGNEWANRTPAEKAEFTEALKSLVKKSYERNLKKTLDFDIEYVGEDASGSLVTVKTRAKSRTNKRDEPVELQYKLAEHNGKWQMRDIITEGVSLVGSYRSQFTKVIKKDGFPALIKKMKDKLAKEK